MVVPWWRSLWATFLLHPFLLLCVHVLHVLHTQTHTHSPLSPKSKGIGEGQVPNSVHNRCYFVRHGTVGLNQSISSTRLSFTCTYLQRWFNSEFSFCISPKSLFAPSDSIRAHFLSCMPLIFCLYMRNIYIFGQYRTATLWDECFYARWGRSQCFLDLFLWYCELSCQDWQSSSQSLAHWVGWLPSPQKWKQSLACEGDGVIDFLEEFLLFWDHRILCSGHHKRC